MRCLCCCGAGWVVGHDGEQLLRKKKKEKEGS